MTKTKRLMSALNEEVKIISEIGQEKILNLKLGGGTCWYQKEESPVSEGTVKYQVDIVTPTQDIQDLLNFDENQLRHWFKELRRSLTNWAASQFEEAIFGFRYGSSTPRNSGKLTFSGLKSLRHEIFLSRRKKGIFTPLDWKLKIEMSLLEWIDLMGDLLPDEGYDEFSCRYQEMDNIRVYFNENPVRGYLKDWKFVIIPSYLHVVETGETSVNPAYYAERFEGRPVYSVVPIRFDVEDLIVSPERENGQLFDCRLISGARISENKLGDKFQIASCISFKVKQSNPELSGFLLNEALSESYSIG